MTKRRPPARRIRSDGWTLPRQRLFIKTLAITGSVDAAANRVGLSTSSAYRLRLHPDGGPFRNAWKAAMGACTVTLRELAFERAINGTIRPVYENGVCVGREPVFNDRLLMFMLRHYDKDASRSLELPMLNSLDYLVEADDPAPEDVSAPADGDPGTDVGNAGELPGTLSGSTG